MAQPLDKISVFNTGPSKNDLAIERLQKDMAGLRGQMDLVSLQHSAIKQDQAKISKDFDAFEVRMNAEKKTQDEYDEDKMDRLMKIEAVLWPYKRREDGWDVQDLEPLLDRVTRLEAHTKADKEAQDEFDETLMSRLAKTDNLLKQQMVQENSLFYRVTKMEKMLADVVLKHDLQLEMQEMDDNYSRCNTIVKQVGGQNAEIKRGIADLDARIVNIYETLQDLKHDMVVAPVETPFFLYTPYRQHDSGHTPSE